MADGSTLTSRDVAARAGVSQATVSRVMNGSDKVSDETRQRVLRALEETGFVLNSRARAMRTARTGTIGLVTSEIQNPFFPYLIDELTRAASELGMRAVVWNDASPDADVAVEALASGAVDGLIFTTAREGMPGLGRLIAQHAPLVLCNRAPVDSAADVVMNDHAASAREAARYLIGHGRTRIAAVFGAADTFATPLRRTAFLAEAEALGVVVPPERVRQGPTAYDAGREAAADLLAVDPEIDTLFCSSDVLAFGAIEAVRRSGRRVPEDVWVMGIDGLRLSEWGVFGLTTMQQDVRAIARDSVERLVDRISEPSRDRVLRLHRPTLVVRESTAHAN